MTIDTSPFMGVLEAACIPQPNDRTKAAVLAWAQHLGTDALVAKAAHELTAQLDQIKAWAQANGAPLCNVLFPQFAPDGKSKIALICKRLLCPPTPRQAGTNPRALKTNPRALGANPKALGTNPKARTKTQPPAAYQPVLDALEKGGVKLPPNATARMDYYLHDRSEVILCLLAIMLRDHLHRFEAMADANPLYTTFDYIFPTHNPSSCGIINLLNRAVELYEKGTDFNVGLARRVAYNNAVDRAAELDAKELRAQIVACSDREPRRELDDKSPKRVLQDAFSRKVERALRNSDHAAARACIDEYPFATVNAMFSDSRHKDDVYDFIRAMYADAADADKLIKTYEQRCGGQVQPAEQTIEIKAEAVS